MSPGLLLVAACAASACAGSVPTTMAPPKGAPQTSYAGMFGIPGEGMSYRVSFRGVSVATVEVAVGRVQLLGARRAIAIHSRGHTAGLMTLLGDIDWKLETTLDLEAGRGVTSREDATVTLAGVKDRVKKDRRWGSGDVFDDLHSAAAKLRAWNPVKGERMRLEVHIDEAQLRIEAWLAGREVIGAPRGPMPAIRYEGLAAGRARFAVWISDDAARVPLRLRAESKWGAIAIDLVEYDPPTDAR